VRVQSREHHVPGERRLNGNLCRFQVADLADEDLVRVLPQDGPQGAGEGQIDLVVDLALDQAVNFVLDRVLGGDDLVCNDVQLAERRIQSRRLAGPGRSGDEGNAVGLGDDLPELRQHVLRHTDLVQV